MKSRFILYIAVLMMQFLPFSQCFALDNDKLLNRPYADNKRFHYGFSLGTHLQDFILTHNGFVTEEGEQWFMDVPAWSPGFNVTLLGDMRLSKYFNLRLTPGMYFGNKVVHFHDLTTDARETQDVKTAIVVVPLEIKASALRYGNIRPYFIGGIMGTFNVGKKRSDYLRFKTADCMLTVGFGIDIYLPFFKLSPELKFCFGLTDVLEHKRPDLSDDPTMMKYTNSLRKATQQMVVLSFFFE